LDAVHWIVGSYHIRRIARAAAKYRPPLYPIPGECATDILLAFCEAWLATQCNSSMMTGYNTEPAPKGKTKSGGKGKPLSESFETPGRTQSFDDDEVMELELPAWGTGDIEVGLHSTPVAEGNEGLTTAFSVSEVMVIAQLHLLEFFGATGCCL
jgi:hypothetical protein